jgi:ubiquinone/menaquinone biosynthesis C-methylase UbiE
MLLATLLRESFTSKGFDRVPETDLVMDSKEAVEAFVRAGQPNGSLSGAYAFYREQACRMIRPGDRVLDLGCGPGLLLGSIAALNQQASFIGVDRSAAMIETGRELLSRLNHSNVDFRIDDMTALSFVESGSVDVVLSSMSLHHLPDTHHLRRCFEAMERVMAPGARVFISDFGRLKRLESVEYFVRRARNESRLEHDYRESLWAAFSTAEFSDALTSRMRQKISIYATAVTPMMVVLMTPFAGSAVADGWTGRRASRALPRNCRADYFQLRLFFRLGGMRCQ